MSATQNTHSEHAGNTARHARKKRAHVLSVARMELTNAWRKDAFSALDISSSSPLRVISSNPRHAEWCSSTLWSLSD